MFKVEREILEKAVNLLDKLAYSDDHIKKYKDSGHKEAVKNDIDARKLIKIINDNYLDVKP